MTSRVSVLHVVLSTATGGMENVIYNLVSAHDPAALRVQVACLEAIGSVSRKLQQRGVPSHLLEPMMGGVSMAYPGALIQHIRDCGCDIVHTHSGCWSKVAAACAWVPRVRLVYTDHGRAFPDTRGRILANRIAVRFTDRVVAVGEPLRQYLLDTVKLPPGKVVTIRNGIDAERFRPSSSTRAAVRAELGYSEGDVVIVIVARLERVKNHELLFAAFRDVVTRCEKARLLVVGDGTLRGDLEGMAGQPPLSGRVQFTGDRPDVERLLTGADIATLSSVSEGTSLTLLEAMASCLPVVATRVGGNETVVAHGHTGLLVAQDHVHYAAALVSLVESESMRRALGENGRRTVIAEWSMAGMARQYQDLYRELVA